MQKQIKETVFQIRVDKTTRETLQHLSKAAGINQSEIIRRLIHQAAQQPQVRVV